MGVNNKQRRAAKRRKRRNHRPCRSTSCFGLPAGAGDQGWHGADHSARAPPLTSAEWNNTTLVNGDVALALGELKKQPGKDIAVFSSSNLTVTLVEQNLVTSCG